MLAVLHAQVTYLLTVVHPSMLLDELPPTPHRLPIPTGVALFAPLRSAALNMIPLRA